jgi:ABC-type Fe3+-hydroxamate transport system substrate-binding protein
METKFAYSVVEPTVSVNRGVPVTVTDSEKATVKVGVLPGIYVELAGAVTEEMVGAVRSMTIVFAELTVGGPVEVPVIEFALSCRINAPSEQLVTVTV